MEIEFESGSQKKLFESSAKLRKKYGEKNAKLLMRRLGELRAASCLDDIRNLPGPSPRPRLHQHTRKKSQKKAVFTVDLIHPLRLVFEVAHDPEPQLPGGGVDWLQVTKILIKGVDDPHG